jgi:hypothetical protein
MLFSDMFRAFKISYSSCHLEDMGEEGGRRSGNGSAGSLIPLAICLFAVVMFSDFIDG